LSLNVKRFYDVGMFAIRGGVDEVDGHRKKDVASRGKLKRKKREMPFSLLFAVVVVAADAITETTTRTPNANQARWMEGIKARREDNWELSYLLLLLLLLLLFRCCGCVEL
jgi:hypothetical protein